MHVEIPIEFLHISPHRRTGPLPRVSAKLLSLMREHGPIEPVTVRRRGPDDYEILGGEETWLAAQRIGIDRVPVHVLELLDDEEAAEIVRQRRSAADPIEEAEELQAELERFGGRGVRGAAAKVAALIGKSRAYVSLTLALLDLPLTIQARVRAGELSGGHARVIARLRDRFSQRQLADRIVAEGLSVRQAEAIGKEIQEGAGPAVEQPAPQEDSADLRRLEQRITETLGCHTTLDPASTKLVIDYHNLDILEGVLERLGVTDL